MDETTPQNDFELFLLMEGSNYEKVLDAEAKSENIGKMVEWLRVGKLTLGWIILIGGTFFNFVTFLVFRRQSLRPYVTSFLLSVVALSNIVVLILGLLPKLIEYNMKADLLRTSIPYFCQIQVFLLYTFLHFTSWTVVLVIVERFLSVWMPQRTQKLCSVRNAKISASLLLLVQIAYNSHLLVTMDVQAVALSGGPLPSTYADADANATRPEELIQLVCDSRPEFVDFHNFIWPLVHLSLFCFIPFIIMVVLNAMIAGRLLLLGNQVVLAATSGSSQAVAQGRRLSGMTTTMFACSLSFFAFTLPVSLYIVVRRGMSEADARGNMSFYVMWTVLNLAQYVNNATVFFYCLFGSLFRRELVRMTFSLVNAVAEWFTGKSDVDVAGEVGDDCHPLDHDCPKHDHETNHVLTQKNGTPSLLEKEYPDPDKRVEADLSKKETAVSKACRLYMMGDSEASVVHQTPKLSSVNHEQKRLLDQFGPTC